MDAFSYLSVLISIILGLAVTQVLQGFRGLILARARLTAYWPCVLWGILLLLIDVQAWWAMYDLRSYQNWSFLGFAVVLSETVPLYLLAGLVFPDVSIEGETNLHTHYFAHHRWFFALAMLLMVASLLKTVTLYGNLPSRPDTAFQVAFFVVCAIAVWTHREWYHKLLTITATAAFVAYIGALFMRLQ